MAIYGQIFEALLTSQRAAGVTLSGGFAYFYSPGTATLKTVYADRSKATPAANPYTLSSNGTATIYGDGLYDVQIKNAAGVSVLPLWEDVALQDASGEFYSLTNYADLPTAVTAIGSTKATLLIPSNTSLSADLTIPITMTLQPINQAIITIASGKTLTINGHLIDPGVQCFSGTVAGLTTAKPEWFGTNTTPGTTDFKTAIENAAAASKNLILVDTYNANGASITNTGLTITGGGTIKNSSIVIGPTGTTPSDMFIKFDGIRFEYDSLTTSQPGIVIQNCRNYTITNCTFTNTSEAIKYAIIDVFQHSNRGLITNNNFYNVNYSLYTDATAATVAYLVGDTTFSHNVSYARVTHLYIPKQDGAVIEGNTFFFPGYQAADATKARHIDSDKSNLLLIRGNQFFESGLESVLLNDAGYTTIDSNHFIWSGQRSRSSAIKLTRTAGVTSVQNIIIANNNINFATMHGIELTIRCNGVTISNNRIYGTSEEAITGMYYGGVVAGPYYHITTESTNNRISVLGNTGTNNTSGTASFLMPTISSSYYNYYAGNTGTLTGGAMDDTANPARTTNYTANDVEMNIAGYDTVTLSQAAPTTVQSFNGSYNGKKLLLYAVNGNTTLDDQYSGTPTTGYKKMVLKGAANVTLSAGQIIKLEFISSLDKWYEVSRNF